MSRRKLGVLLVSAIAASAIATAGASADNQSGFKTSRPSMVTGVMPGVEITPLLTVGDVLGSGYRFEAIPDGIGGAHTWPGSGRPVRQPRDGEGSVPVQQGEPHGGQRRERFRQLAGEPADPQPALGRRAERLLRPAEQARLPALLLELPRDEQGGVLARHPLHERGVARLRAPAGGLVAARARQPGAEGSGLVVALDVQTGKHYEIHGMGRHNHENSVPIPGYDDLVVLSGDDTFTSGPLRDPLDTTAPFADLAPSQSQLYSYIAPDTGSLLADEGELWAFRSTRRA